MRIDRHCPPLLASAAAGTAAGLIALLSSLDVLDLRGAFVALTLTLLGYLGVEVARLCQRQPERWLANPVVLASVMTFVLAHGVSNFLFFGNIDELLMVSLVPEVTASMVKLMYLVLVGAVAMWFGYWSTNAGLARHPDQCAAWHRRILPPTNTLHPLTLPLLIGIATGARLLQIELGVFGYASSYERLIEMGSVTQYLSMAASLGSMALVLASLQLFRAPPSQRHRAWFAAVLILEFLTGVLSGFKSALVMPFLIVAICHYLSTGRWAVKWLLLAAMAIPLGYAVVEPFRNARNYDADFSGDSVAGIASAVVTSTADTSRAAVESAPVLLAFAARLNLSYIASFGIEYADRPGGLPDTSPNFLTDLVLAPLHAWIPRAIWEGKPLGNIGLWYTYEVMERDVLSSSAMGPVAYLYFAGGAVAVFLGFAFIGAAHRVLLTLLRPTESSPGAVVFLAVLMPLINVDSAFNSILIMLWRELPLALAIQFLLFRSSGSPLPRVAHPA
ncbi:hypothetical protein AACH10_06520 [Ideonella sp. DXS22W]|uniref:O-antigen polysaccharide polymerase Wzy n=1 Tax=Pseudaquabacterium inlustre TaxID=2984192 RepID=A0ABU9CDC1_9BURK